MAKAETGVDLYKKGNECFVSEDYDRAIDLYTSALQQDPGMLECYAAKAQALIRSERYDQAKAAADRGIDILRGISAQEADNKPSDELKKCLQRSGVASFHLGRYKEAKNTFSEAKKLDPEDKGITQWMTWCDEKIAKFGEDASKRSTATQQEQAKPSEAAPTDTKSSKNSASDTDTSQTAEAKSSTEAAAAKETAAPAAPNNEMPVPKIKHDWYQTETHVIVEVRIKKLDPNDVKVDFHEVSLSVTAKLALGSDYSLELDLAHPVIPDQSSYKVLSTKLEIKLRKTEAVRWNNLEGDGSAPLPGGALPSSSATPQGVKAPYASGRDWNKVEKMLAAEADEKKEGEQALNEMFQKIYSDASDDVKKAMNKSFSESGGTVLSTNWNDIGKEKTDVKPPDGMEFKKWE